MITIGAAQQLALSLPEAVQGSHFHITDFRVNKKIFAIAGAATPTEIMSAWDFGVPLIKVFPVSAFSGAAYIKSLQGVMPQVRLLPVGGITFTNASDFLQAGAFAIGIGSSLFQAGYLVNDNYASIAEQARNFTKLIDAITPT